MTATATAHTAENRVWITRCPVPTASSIAFDQGLLAGELAVHGLRAASLQDEPDPALRRAHFDHALTGLVREGGNIPALWARSTGRETRLVALTWADEYQAVLARPHNTIAEPADLRGLRLGVPRHADQQIDFRAAMALHGFESALGLASLTLDDVVLVDLHAPPREARWSVSGAGTPHGQWDLEAEALLRGDVDAIYVKGAPGVEIARTIGAREVVDLGFDPDPLVRVNNGTPRTVTVDAALLEREGAVESVLTALLRAADWAAAHRADLDRVLASETGAAGHGIARAYRDAPLHPDLSDAWLDALDAQRAFLARHGFLAGDVDVRAWVEPAPLAVARALVAPEPPHTQGAPTR
jgi:ABC-type nitrate/sulfonate/bicarbonate transport system substrate-binding protein